MRPRTELSAAQVGAIHRAMLAAPGKPCLSAFILETALPFTVLGPVDFWAFRRLASNFTGVMTIGFLIGGCYEIQNVNMRITGQFRIF
jgi:hypothetical protein